MYTKVVVSGKTVEVYRYEREPVTYLWGRAPLRKKSLYKRPRGSNRRRRDNLDRLRKSFIRLVRSNLVGNECPSFITLTFANDLRVEDAYRCLAGYMAKLRYDFGEAFRYIAVPEFQKRGTIHFHILAWGISQEIIKNERRTRYLQNLWALGFVDCIATDGSEKLAGYLAKYMSKAMHDYRLDNTRAYVCSRNIMRAVSLPGTSLDYFPELFGELGVDIDLLTERSFETQWLGSAHYQQYKLRD